MFPVSRMRSFGQLCFRKREKNYAQAFTICGCFNIEHMAIEDQSMMYAMCFDKAKPVHVSCQIRNVEGEGLILVLPSAEAGHARTLTGTLPEEEITKLCEDQATLHLEKKMLLLQDMWWI
ncbi:Protein ECERIFERUM 26-like [Melia azedarach]|uniref:Protein ECERIFERUM 26-like n=1 Tax=Melia azedarach TaxID=155640 RepID=A0ACC1Y872_MELAZ|nr:Protein ECERIFERUM 26-like [Melia azedarach]